MTAAAAVSDLMARLRTLDVRLYCDGDRVRISAPEGVMTDALRSELAAHKQGILAYLKQTVGELLNSATAINLNSHLTALPLSFSQEALWFLDQSLPMRHIYNMGLALRLRGGELNTSALQEALEYVVTKHEALRTAFIEGANGPQQVIQPPGRFELSVVDLRVVPAPRRELELRLRATKFWRMTFDLSFGLLIRAVLYHLDNDDHVLVVPTHHIVTDERSIDILGREIGESYKLFAAGRKLLAGGSAIRYADFAVWQREYLRGEILDELIAYWRERLSGTAGVLNLPTEHVRPSIPTYRGAKLKLLLTRELSEGLRALGRNEGTTLFMTLLAAFYVLLYRYTGQEDLNVGAPISGRAHVQTESLVGYFVNMLVLRARVDGHLTFRDLLRHVREVVLGAFSHQDLPFEKLVEVLRPQRDAGRNPFFQATIDVRADNPDELEFGGLTVEPFDFDADGDVAKFDLTMSVIATGEELRVQFCYATDIFGPETVQRMMGHFVNLLEGIVANPDLIVNALPMLPASERHLLLHEWNDSKAEFPTKCVHQLFEDQVLRSPDAVAVVNGESSLSYAELNRRANRMAHYLRTLGVRPDTRVAICVARGVDMIIALLAVLKAGGSYVPLDPSYPVERLRFLLQDCAPVVLLTQSHFASQFPGLQNMLPWVLTDAAQIWQDLPDGNPEPETVGLDPSHLAYVIYTSGSTGVPKGVMIEHRNTVNFLTWAKGAFSRDALERTLFSTSLYVHLAVYELFLPLCVGCTVVLVENAPLLAHEPVAATLLNTVPSAMKMLVDAGKVPATVRTVNLAGEALRRELVDRLFATTGVEEVRNFYGPSETTTYSTWVAMNRATGFTPGIGRPISNTRIYILDACRQPVPVGVVGELYISGAGVARGYLNRADLTAECFLKDPFVKGCDARMYRTGDLGRWLADGNIELTLNGKLDREVLPAPGADACAARGIEAPIGEVETRVAAIWADVLELDRVGRDDNFFELGGHSLLLLKMRTAVVNMSGKAVPVAELFRHPTIRTLAMFLTEREDDTLCNEGTERGRLQRAVINRRRQLALQRRDTQ